MLYPVILATAVLQVVSAATPVTISSTSGQLRGLEQDGVMSFKGIRFAEPPINDLRWAPPVPFTSSAEQNANILGPSCIQQFAFATSNLIRFLFNNPPPPENEDCLFLNVWAPSTDTSNKKPVVVWIYGGSLAFGTASLPLYDGTSIASNQDLVVVSFNYRTNVFGFPSSPDLPLQGNNLGFLDQDLALIWVQQNIAKFGGDPSKVTIMGESAGGLSVSTLLLRHGINPPFRSGVMLSGVASENTVPPNSSSFDQFASAVGCNQAAGSTRLSCLKAIPASTISEFVNGPTAGVFRPVTDNSTFFSRPLERVAAGITARVPIILGNMEDDGSLFAIGLTNLTQFMESQLGSAGVALIPRIRAQYPDAANDNELISDVIRDFSFQCPARLWAEATRTSGQQKVFRYIYGAVFADLQLFPNAGAWHSTEIQEIFGTYNRTTATDAEATLSSTFQTTIANFVKDPTEDPVKNWKEFPSLAKLAFNGNVDPDNVVDLVPSDSVDQPCLNLWDAFLTA